MEEKKFYLWRKLDNAAIAFPAAADKKDTRVFRFYCELTQTVIPVLLQKALDRTVQMYPVFQTVLRKGLFWYYLEHRDLQAMVTQESKKTCSRIYVPDEKKLLFDVTYYKTRINLEVFHVLTDGTGAIQFFRELVKNYLFLAHDGEGLEDVTLEEESGSYTEYEADSFSKYYSSRIPRLWEMKHKAYQISGEKVEGDDVVITEMTTPLGPIRERARSLGVSLTVFLVSVLLCAIHADRLDQRKADPFHPVKNQPITLMVPINLRSYFPSQSMTNFWGWIEVGYRFEQDTTFSDVLAYVKDYFKRELKKERVQQRMNDYIRLEKNPLVRIVPLEIKNLGLQAGILMRDQNMTAVLSNVGQIRMPREYMAYIHRFGVYTNTKRMQITCCSYGDELYLGFSTKLVRTNIQEHFIRILETQDLSCRIEEVEYPKQEAKEQPAPWKIFFSRSAILALLAAFLCILGNILFLPFFFWSIFACGGIFCVWILGAVGFVKRRNILKNMLWQLVIGTLICIGWDVCTGWYGWSLDFVFPIYTLLVLICMVLIAKITRMETMECLIYFVMNSILGLVPGILVVTGRLRIREPSMLCTLICFLSLCRIIIFKYQDLKLELKKNLRL